MTPKSPPAAFVDEDFDSPATAFAVIRNAPEDSPERLLGQAYDLILEAFGRMGYDIHDDNFRDTGPRAAKGLLELVRSVGEIELGVDELVGKSFTARYDEMVISKQNVCFGLCPHHLLPVIYRVSIAYLPSKKVLGISKLSRLARLLARRPVLQEQLTQDLAEVLHTRLRSRGSAAYVEGLHLCMAARGSESHEARVVTSAVRGLFREQPATRQEFLNLVTTAQTPLV
jgi:GTP cyclohydrolase I